jgi:hypothetical protein
MLILMVTVDLAIPTDLWMQQLRGDLRDMPHEFRHFGLPSALLFVSGASLGKWIRRRKENRRYESSSISSRLATPFVVPKRDENAAAFQKRVQLWSTGVAAIAPILSFGASIIVAFIGYLGAVKAH